MGKKNPALPDYNAIAQQQGQANLAAGQQSNLLSNPNMITPYGSSSFTIGPDGRPINTQTLSPAEQSLFDAGNQAKLGGLNTLNQSMPNINAALTQPFGLAGGVLQGGYAPGSTVGQTQTNLDFSGAPAMPQANEAARQAVTNAVYQQGARFLDPQFAQAQRDQAAQLANQGIVANPGDPNSAYGRATDQLARQKMEAYGNLGDTSTQTGIGAMNTLFGMGLAARQQGVGETEAQGQFHNAATVQQANIAQQLAALMGAQRGQAYSEYANNRTMPINMWSALLNGGQVNNPTFNAYNPQQILPAPLMQGAIAQGQAQTAGASANAGLLGSGIGGLGSALGGGGLSALLSYLGSAYASMGAGAGAGIGLAALA